MIINEGKKKKEKNFELFARVIGFLILDFSKQLCSLSIRNGRNGEHYSCCRKPQRKFQAKMNYVIQGVLVRIDETTNEYFPYSTKDFCFLFFEIYSVSVFRQLLCMRTMLKYWIYVYCIFINNVHTISLTNLSHMRLTHAYEYIQNSYWRLPVLICQKFQWIGAAFCLLKTNE